MDKNCGNCYSHCYGDGMVKKVDGPIVRCLQYDQWKPSYNYLKKENADLKSQLAAYQRHPFNPEDRGTWPPNNLDVLFCEYGGAHTIGHIDDRNYLISEMGILVASGLTIARFYWWCKLPGEEGE